MIDGRTRIKSFERKAALGVDSEQWASLQRETIAIKKRMRRLVSTANRKHTRARSLQLASATWFVMINPKGQR